MKFNRSSLLLYAVTDRAWLNGAPLAARVADCLRGGATCVQLREKDLPFDAFLDEARAVRAVCKEHDVPFIVNDSVEIVPLCDADGVHVGQSDTSVPDVRKRLGRGKIVGVSVQTVAQAVLAEAQGADYLGVGAVFPTGTKPDAELVSRATLQEICAAVRIPVVAIGGISADRIQELCGVGIAGVAVVSAIFASQDVERATRTLLTRTKEVIEHAAN